MVEFLGAAFLFCVPVVAALVAGSRALASDAPGEARRRALLGTWGLGIALGVGGGLLVDLFLFFFADRGHAIPAFLAYGMVQVVASGAAGVVAGWICAYIVGNRA